MIVISQTFEIVTPESAEIGEVAESGFDFEDREFEFRELVEYIQDNGFYNPSESHGVPRWLSSDPGTGTNWSTGEDETKSIHPAKDRVSQRYWEKACRAAGIIK